MRPFLSISHTNPILSSIPLQKRISLFDCYQEHGSKQQLLRRVPFALSDARLFWKQRRYGLKPSRAKQFQFKTLFFIFLLNSLLLKLSLPLHGSKSLKKHKIGCYKRFNFFLPLKKFTLLCIAATTMYRPLRSVLAIGRYTYHNHYFDH